MRATIQSRTCTRSPLTPPVTAWWIFYTFIHFNFMPGVLLTCWCAACISPLRRGSRTRSYGAVSRCPSSTIICSSGSLCLLALSLFITVVPFSFCHRRLRAPWCTTATAASITTSDLSAFAVRNSLCSFHLSGAIFQDGLSLCLFYCQRAKRPRPLYGRCWASQPEFWPWSSDRKNFREAVSRKTVRERGHWWGYESLHHVLCWQLSPPLPVPTQRQGWLLEMVGMDGTEQKTQLWLWKNNTKRG